MTQGASAPGADDTLADRFRAHFGHRDHLYGSLLAEMADASIIVTTAGRGTVAELASVASVLAQAERPVLGAVINRVARRDLSYGAYAVGGYGTRASTGDSPWSAPLERMPRRRPDYSTVDEGLEAPSSREPRA